MLSVFDSEESLTKDYLAKIGEITFHFNELEEHICLRIWRLIWPKYKFYLLDKKGRIITGNLTFRSKAELLFSLCEAELSSDKMKVFKEIYGSILDCNRIRNDVLHSRWHIFPDRDERGGLFPTRKINIKNGSTEDVVLEKLDKYAKQILHTNILLSKFFPDVTKTNLTK